MTKKIIVFAAQVMVTTIVFTSVLWLFHAIVDRDNSLDWEMVAQGVLFSLVYVALTRRHAGKKEDKE